MSQVEIMEENKTESSGKLVFGKTLCRDAASIRSTEHLMNN
jgi:hypothetical protein